MERKLVKIQGLPVDTFTFDEAIEYSKDLSGQVVTINPEMIESAQKKSEFKKIVENADLIIPDGIGVEIGLRILGYKVRRIAGIEFARALINEFSKLGKSIALVGSRPEVVEKAKENLEKEVENINIVYTQDGYYNDENRVLVELEKVQPRLLLIALGSPKQEHFIEKVKKILPDTLMIGVGGSFDVWSGMVERAPEIYRKLWLEWLYRTIKEPKRFKRIFPTLPLFVINVVKERLFGV